MGIQKTYLKSKPICKVKFTAPKELTQAARTVNLVGDFNDWDVTARPMRKLRDGSFTIVMDLPCGHEYAYRYFINGSSWENDSGADKYVASPFPDANNSVVVV